MKKRISVLMIACMLVLFLLPASVPAAETEKISYLDEDGTGKTTEKYTPIDSNYFAKNGFTLTEGWYAVSGDVEISNRIVCEGAVRLILLDGFTLRADAGIEVSGTKTSLTVYAGTKATDTEALEGTGNLIAAGGSRCAGIGGSSADGRNVTISGGTVTATGGGGAAGIGGGYSGSGENIRITGGTVIATGTGSSAGIGGGKGGHGTNVTIEGGMVTATGGGGGAGIGGGEGNGDKGGSGSNITISGGMVTAKGTGGGAGIGGGCVNDSSPNGIGTDITINGGTVTATGTYYSAGIGGSNGRAGQNITVNGGTVIATGGQYGGAGIGGGNGASGPVIAVNGGTVTATGGEEAAGIGGGKNSVGSTDITTVTVTGNVHYLTKHGAKAADSPVEPVKRLAAFGGGTEQHFTMEPCFAVTFDMGGHGVQIAMQQILSGEKAEKPAAPADAVFEFGGWFSDEARTAPFDFGTAVTADLTLYAKWTGEYAVTKGNGQSYTQGSGKALSFTCNGALDRFTGLLIDGSTVSKDGYKKKSGSTVVTLKEEFLETLDAGTHTLQFLYADGESNVAEFRVEVKPAPVPKTGDGNRPLLWAGLMLLAGAGLALMRKRRA